MKIYNTRSGALIAIENRYYLLKEDWDELINKNSLLVFLKTAITQLAPYADYEVLLDQELLPPVQSQEIWASGVTYYRSREARIEESKDAGGGDFYDRVYAAERPELFFKSAPYRAVGHSANVRIRKDAKWNVPEPELTLVINAAGAIIGYTIGNDMSSRDIEGENPLYLPQAKCYDGSCAVGPCIYLTDSALSPDTEINITIVRNDDLIFSGATMISQMKRQPVELVSYLYREMSFPHGALLMTGTGIVPPDSFTLAHGDIIHIVIAGIGRLSNRVGI